MCSLGVRVKISGVQMALTAGHCPGGSHYTGGGVPAGNLYTTAYPGNAYLYGDWKLLSGVSYSGNVFNGGLYSSSKLPGVGINFTPLPDGHKVCTSGRTTAQLCNFWVDDTSQSVTINGVTSGRQTRIIVDDQSTWNPQDCTGFDQGDSGGPVYYNNGSGGMMYVGLVKGVTWWWFGTQKRCSYYFTQLDGVRAWNSGVTW